MSEPRTGARRDRVLVAEDDPGLRELVAMRLGEADVDVRAVGSGEEAISAIRGEAFDLLLLDYILGDMTGGGVLDALAEAGTTPPFIVTTGQGSESLAVDIMKRGARDYLVKDVGFLDRLPEQVRKTLRQIDTERRLAELEARIRRAEQLETLARVTGGIAHEFHNLLAVIKNAAWLLGEQRPKDEAVRRYAPEIERHVEYAAALTGRLLAFTEATPGHAEPVHAGGLLGEVAELLGRQDCPGVTITVDAPPETARIRGDLARLREMLLDIGRNACEAMPSGGGLAFRADTVTLAHAEADREGLLPGDYLRIEVSDTGAGMDAETRARAFEPFFTTRAGGASVGGNVGLGLAAAHGCARAHGGAIGLRSEPGAGTTVRLYLPLLGETVAASP